MSFRILGLTLAGAAMLAGGPAWAQDAAKGEQLFKRCAVCHAVEPNVNKVGPTLHGVVMRPAGAVPDYNYSEAMKASGVTWDDASLDAYLADPKGYIPKNKMAFPGLKNPQDRIDVIAYLKTVSPAP